MAENSSSTDSEQELRWQRWQEKGQRANQLAENRMTILFAVVALILLVLIFYYALR